MTGRKNEHISADLYTSVSISYAVRMPLLTLIGPGFQLKLCLHSHNTKTYNAVILLRAVVLDRCVLNSVAEIFRFVINLSSVII